MTLMNELHISYWILSISVGNCSSPGSYMPNLIKILPNFHAYVSTLLPTLGSAMLSYWLDMKLYLHNVSPFRNPLLLIFWITELSMLDTYQFCA